VYITKQRIIHLSWCIPYGAEFVSKVLGKEFEEKPFFKRVCLNNTHKASPIYTYIPAYQKPRGAMPFSMSESICGTISGSN